MTNRRECRIRRETSATNSNIIQRHEFDPASGWCVWGCGCRNDGRTVSAKDGRIFDQGREYTAEDLEHFREYLAHRYPRPVSNDTPADVAHLRLTVPGDTIR
ncbi:hypothetical protein [Microbacterium dauci]|uniref:Uncharacterized protein n=1 Tax=Microbacterium dauci TaxID=3048008 RepID=A0ABT6ZHF8_9MICO|nr:hypothetical protein [Microbacterium sp. LX3-4]MDJ1115396.1 hypothetical protein [Microbacterium sp. LX3-4]